RPRLPYRLPDPVSKRALDHRPLVFATTAAQTQWALDGAPRQFPNSLSGCPIFSTADAVRPTTASLSVPAGQRKRRARHAAVLLRSAQPMPGRLFLSSGKLSISWNPTAHPWPAKKVRFEYPT